MNLNPFKKKGVGKKQLAYTFPRVISNVPVVETQTDVRIRRLEETAGSLRPPFDRVEHLDKSRSKIAFKFVRWYFALISLLIIGVPLYNKWIGQATGLDLGRILDQIGTLLGTP